MKQTAIIGVGNRAAGDDSIGMRVLDALRQAELPPNVVLVEAGLAGPGLVSQMEEYAKVVLVDAVNMGLSPGTVRTFTPDAVKSVKPVDRLSLHSCDLLEIIELASRLGVGPEEVVIVGIQPEPMASGRDVSEEVLTAIPTAVEHVLNAACARSGRRSTARPRSPHTTTDEQTSSRAVAQG